MAHPRRSFSRGPKRQVAWINSADQGYLTVSAGSKAIHQSFAPATAGLLKPTIVRTRGVVSFKSTQAAADAEVIGAYGMAIVSDQAFAAGAASIPGPFTDADWDGWFLWGGIALSLQFVDATGVYVEDRLLEVDSKAMRKVSDNETVVFMVESQAVAFEFAAVFRELFKLG